MRERVVAVIRKGDGILVVRDDKAVDFGLPGGGVDEGETKEQALVRELKEELNLDVVSSKFRESFECLNTIYNVPQLNHVYEVEVTGEIVPDHEIEEWFWMTAENVRQHTHEFYKDELELIYPKILAL